MINKEFGMKVSSLRKERGLTQVDLAEKLNISNKAVSRWETGEGYPETTLLLPLAEALGVSVDYLLSSEDAAKEEKAAEKLCRNSWVKVTVYNKISAIALAIVIGFFLFFMIFMFLYIGNGELAKWFPLVALIGSVLIKVVPTVGIVSAIIGIVIGSIGKGEKQNKLAIGLLALNLLLPLMWLLVIFVID